MTAGVAAVRAHRITYHHRGQLGHLVACSCGWEQGVPSSSVGMEAGYRLADAHRAEHGVPPSSGRLFDLDSELDEARARLSAAEELARGLGLGELAGQLVWAQEFLEATAEPLAELYQAAVARETAAGIDDAGHWR